MHLHSLKFIPKLINIILEFCDEHPQQIFWTSFFVYLISDVLFLLFHTPEYGYEQVNVYEILGLIIIPIVIMYSNKDLYKTKHILRREVSLIYLLFLIISIIDLLIAVYSIFVGKISFVFAIFVSIIMFVLCALMTHSVFQVAFNSVKSFVILFTDYIKSFFRK